MNEMDAVALLSGAVPPPPRTGSWADLGAGDGTFSRALARLLRPGSRIYAVDRDADAIAAVGRSSGVDGVDLIPVIADFTHPLRLPGVTDHQLDGMLFANALHFVPEPRAVLSRLVSWLRPGGRVVIIEYDGRRANRWLPYPIPATGIADVLSGMGLSMPTITATRPSAYGGTLYVAAATAD